MAPDPSRPPPRPGSDAGMTGELRALTGMRGIAAWLVVIYHIRLSIAGLPEAWLAIFAKGYLAVDFFFLLSGFVIWLSWGERLRRDGARAVPHFLHKRLARIWPLHLFMLACATALALLLAMTGRHSPDDYPFAQLPLHILLLQNWGFTDHLAWNDPSWSISAEFAAYLLFPLLALGIDWKRMQSAMIVAAITALFVLLHAVMAQGGAMSLGTDIARFGLLRCITEFAAGTAICALWLRWRADAVPALVGSALVAATCMVGWAFFGLPETLAVPPLFACVLLMLALTSSWRGNLLASSPLRYLGEISYATYLGHFLLFVVFKLVLVDDAGAIPPALIMLYLVMTLAASVALYHLVERPAQRWLNELTLPGRSPKRKNQASASSS